MSREPRNGPSNRAVRDKAAPTGEQPLSREELRAVQAEVASGPAAERNLKTMLALVDVDPWHAHVYWHVDPTDLAQAAKRCGSQEKAPMLLRVQDHRCARMTGFIPWPPIEVAVTELDGYQYVEIPDPGKALVAELGLHGPSGAFEILARSAVIRMPNAGVAGGESTQLVELARIDRVGAPARETSVAPAPQAAADELALLFGLPAPSATSTSAQGVAPLLRTSPTSSQLAEEGREWSGGIVNPLPGGDHD